jgi:hypothetical protein
LKTGERKKGWGRERGREGVREGDIPKLSKPNAATAAVVPTKNALKMFFFHFLQASCLPPRGVNRLLSSIIVAGKN